jgi:hypothetical protein
MASDAFNRADENPLASPWSAMGSWSACKLVSNGVMATVPGADNASKHTSTETSSQVTVTSVGSTVDGGPIICINSTNAYAFVSYDGVNLYLFRIDSGSFTSIDFVGGTAVVVNDVMRIYRDGNDVVATLNGVEQMRATDTTYMTGNSGVFCFAGDLVLDDWTDGAAAAVANVDSEHGSRRNRPGRGPYSLGRYFRQRVDAFNGSNLRDVAGSTTLTFDQAAQLKAFGNVSASTLLTFAQAGRASAYGNVAASTTLTFAQAGSAGAYGNVVASALHSYAVSGDIDAYANVSGTTSISFLPTALISAYAVAVGATTLTFNVEGSFGLDGDLQGTTTLTFATQANLSARAALYGQTSLTFDASGRLSSGSGLSGSASLTFDVTGRAQALINAQGTATLTFGASAIIKAFANATVNASISFSLTGALSAIASASGASSIVFTVTGRLATPFNAGTILFGVPMQVEEFKIAIEKTTYSIH